jgi:hypothetical protein
VDFSLQVPGNAALFAVVCAIALHRAPAPCHFERQASRPKLAFARTPQPVE